MTGIVGIWLAGCADATRFADSGSPFSNPFASASNESVAPTPKISSRPLAEAKPYNQSYATDARPNPAAVASAHAPTPEATGSIRSRPEPVGGSAAGWSAVGGSPIIVGPNDDAAALSARYEVPEAALLAANGLHSRADIRPNMRIVIPVYNANARGDARVAKADEDKSRKADSGDGDHKMRKTDAKRDEGEDGDSAKLKRAEADHKKHKADAKRDGEDEADAPQRKKTAKADKAEEEKVAKADKRKDKAEDPSKAEKHVKDLAKSEKAAKAETEVAKAEPMKLPKKADTDQRATSDLASASSANEADESGKFRWPARGRIIQGFKAGGNDGINIALPEGTSVRAAEDGKVAYAGSALKGYGNLVLIRHPNGFVTAYANNGELDVKSGDTVKRGQVIAKSGQTGDVSTPQLHFELRRGQTPVDPTNYLAGL